MLAYRLRVALAVVIGMAIVVGAVAAAIWLSHHGRYGRPINLPVTPSAGHYPSERS